MLWWCSMSYVDRISYSAFIENKDLIESRWDKDFGDRENELVFIGQDLNKETLQAALESCLLNYIELNYFKNKEAKPNQVKILSSK
jgi:hypothetical protein